MDVKHSVTAAGRKDCFDPVVLILHSASVTQTAGEESEEFALLDNKKKTVTGTTHFVFHLFIKVFNSL